MCARRRSWTKNAVQEISGRTCEAGPGRASQLCWQVSKGAWPRHRQTLLNLNPPTPQTEAPPLCSFARLSALFLYWHHFNFLHKSAAFSAWVTEEQTSCEIASLLRPPSHLPLLDRDVAASAVPPNLWYSPNAACRKSWMKGKRESVKREALYYDQRGVKIK